MEEQWGINFLHNQISVLVAAFNLLETDFRVSSIELQLR